MKEREISNVSAGSQGEGSNREQASPTPCLRKKGGTAGDDDQEGLGWPPVNSHCVSSFLNTNPQQSHLFSVKLGAKSKKGRKQHTKARDIKRGYRLTRGGSNREQASQTPRLRKKGATAGDGDREGLGWPPREHALLFVLPELQSTTIPPLLHKA